MCSPCLSPIQVCHSRPSDASDTAASAPVLAACRHRIALHNALVPYAASGTFARVPASRAVASSARCICQSSPPPPPPCVLRRHSTPIPSPLHVGLSILLCAPLRGMHVPPCAGSSRKGSACVALPRSANVSHRPCLHLRATASLHCRDCPTYSFCVCDVFKPPSTPCTHSLFLLYHLRPPFSSPLPSALWPAPSHACTSPRHFWLQLGLASMGIFNSQVTAEALSSSRVRTDRNCTRTVYFVCLLWQGARRLPSFIQPLTGLTVSCASCVSYVLGVSCVSLQFASRSPAALYVLYHLYPLYHLCPLCNLYLEYNGPGGAFPRTCNLQHRWMGGSPLCTAT